MNPLVRRAGAALAASALAFSGVALLSSPASAATDPRPVDQGAAWLTGQLTDGIVVGHYVDGSGVTQSYDDFGLTLDFGMSLRAVGGHASTVADISAALAPRVDEAYDSFGTIYTGSAAKAAVFAQSVGADAADYDGTDVLGVVATNTASDAPIAGRIQNVGEIDFVTGDPTDTANTFGQALAVSALTTASDAKAPAALDFLLKQQCSAGYFRLYMTADKTASDQTCDGGRAAGASAPDPDATSLAIRMLLPQLDTSAKAARAIGRAEAWLLAQQHSDGSFGGGTSTVAPNSNSTGLAGWTLGLLGNDEAATKAAVWVRQHQADELAGCANNLSDQTGAIGYDDAAVAAGRAKGITVGAEDQWRRTTAPVLPVLEWAPAMTPALTASGPVGYVKAGSTASYRFSGVTPGDKVCVKGIGADRTVAAGAAGSIAVPVAIPAGTATRTLTVTDRDGSTGTVVTKVLGAKTLSVRAPAIRVKRGKSVRVTVSGLAAGENVTMRLRGVVVASGKATPSGTFVKVVKVGRRLGVARVGVTGQFGDIRHGGKVLAVTR